MRLLRRRFAAASQPIATVRVFRDDAMSGIKVINRLLSRAAIAGKFLRYLDQADISQRVGLVLGAVLLVGLLGGRITWGLTSSWYWAVLGVGTFGSLPLLYVRRRKRRRLNLYAEQLADALDVLTRSLQAGQSFMQGVQTVAREMPEPTAREFGMTFELLRLGRSLREALQSHANRVESLDFNLVCTALLIQRDVGGNITEILENTSRMIRARFKLLGEIRTLSAQTSLSGKIVGALPIAIGVMIYLMKPDLVMVLFTDEIGKMAVKIAIVMQIVGFYVMNRITTIKV
jgi:tight adherence protein B